MDQAVYYMIKDSEVDPQDHEVPATIAEWLYLLDLPESAGIWASKAQAIAPEAPVTQRMNLFQAYALGGEKAAAKVALEMIKGNIGIRGFGIFWALWFYVEYSHSIGNAEQAMALLKQHYPHMDDPSAKPESFEGYYAEMLVLQLGTSTNPEFDGARAADLFTKKLLSLGLAPDDFGGWYVNLALMRGDLVAATDFAMKEHFDKPWAVDPPRLIGYSGFFFQPLTQVPEIAAKLSEWERDRQQQRAATIAMLETLD